MKQKQVELERMMVEIKEERDRMAREQEAWRLQQQAELQQQKEEMRLEMKRMMAEQLLASQQHQARLYF